MFFPDEKLYFQPGFEGLEMNVGDLDGVVVHKIKRLIANFDYDKEDEMAVMIIHSTGMCTFCIESIVIAILDEHNKKVNVAWEMKDRLAFDRDDMINISTIKLFKKDKFFGLICVYNEVPIETGSSYIDMSIIRWDGKKYSEVWKYTIYSSDSGGRGGVPHDYQAKVEFSEDKVGIKKIKVSGIYAFRSYSEEQPGAEHEVKEEFAWDEKKQRYVSIIKKPK